MLDFRKLIASDEPSFLNKVHNVAMQDATLTGLQKEEVKSARRRFAEVLDQRADYYRVVPGAEPPTVRQMLDDWINGEWFHSDAKKRDAREAYELGSAEDALSLNLIVPALRAAIEAARQLDLALP